MQHLRESHDPRGFTLVEVLVTVFIIAVLAALAIYGVTRYLASSKSSEAKNNVGAISRSAHAAHARELAAAENLDEGDRSVQAANLLCESSVLVPATVPKGTKYQPSTQEGDDFETGDNRTGWRCLKFAVSQPVYYQLAYTKDSTRMAPNNPAKCNVSCYEAGARGDLNGNDVYAEFARTGHINAVTGRLKAASQIYVTNEFE